MHLLDAVRNVISVRLDVTHLGYDVDRLRGGRRGALQLLVMMGGQLGNGRLVVAPLMLLLELLLLLQLLAHGRVDGGYI